MSNPVDPAEGWNYFTRVLKRIAIPRGLTLWQVGSKSAIHSQKITRLLESYAQPGKFTVLNRADLTRIAEALVLSEAEKQELAGAILVTGLQAQMTRHLRANHALTALEAADAIYPLILGALTADPLYVQEIFSQEAHIGMMPDDQLNHLLDHALELIDHANLALHLSQSATEIGESINNAVQARYDFLRAIVELENQLPTTRQSPEWQLWRDEAAAGLQEVSAFLQQNGL